MVEAAARSSDTERQGRAAPLAMLRPHHWVKNLLIFVPLAAAHLADAAAWIAALITFVCFSAIVSAGYVANDLADRAADRAHPEKAHRAIAAGRVAPGIARASAVALAAAGLGAAALALPMAVALILALYLAGTLAYSLVLKRLLALDIVTIAGLLVLRLFAGGEAAAVQISHWLLAFALFFFLGLAAVKRLAELTSGGAPIGTRLPGRAYRVGDEPALTAIAAGCGFVSVLVLALYISDAAAAGAYGRPEWLWGICLILAYWIGRAILLACRGEIAQDPVVFGLTDLASWIAMGLIAACLTLAALG